MGTGDGRTGGADARRATLDGLFPAGVACVAARAPGAGTGLFPEEARAATRFAPGRLAEFRLGRECARRALQLLGAPVVAIPPGAHREPVWPEGVVGSISHAGGMAAAAVAWRRDFQAIGLDIEATTALEPALFATVCGPGERQRLAAAGAGAAAEAMLVFSAKEAVYKALWPTVRRFIDFQEVEIGLDPARDEFTVTAAGPGGLAPLAAALRGRVLRHPQGIAAGAWLAARDACPPSAGA